MLQKLLYDRRMNASELAREVDLPTPTVHRMVTGKSTRPYRSSLQPIADYFSISVDQLLGEEPLPEGGESTTSDVGFHTKAIPLIPWNDLSADLKEVKASKKVPFIGEISKEGFATILPDASMEPMFAENSILIIDPKKHVKDRGYVLVLLGETQVPAFRQILIDADEKYLKALNKDLNDLQMRMVSEKDTILGGLVESRMNFGA